MAKKNGVKVLNPPFHPQMQSIGAPGASAGLTRGWLIQAPDATKSQRARINFLYNPSAISVSHTVAMELSSNPETGSGSNTSVDNLGQTAGQGNIAIPLLFDRTYELWDSSYHNKPEGQLGAYADVLAFYDFCNLTNIQTSPISGAAYYSDGSSVIAQMWANRYPVNPMMPTMAYAYIGGFRRTKAGESVSIPGSRLKYYGQITSLDITYTHWTQSMIPMRCAINVGLELLTDPNANSERVSIGITSVPKPKHHHPKHSPKHSPKHKPHRPRRHR